MNLRILICRAIFVLVACSALVCRAGIRIVPQTNNENNVYLHPLTIQYGLGSPAVGKIAYVFVTTPSGVTTELAEAENVADYSQSVSYTPTQVGTYTFYYKYSFISQGVPITTVTSLPLTTVQNASSLSNSTTVTYAQPYQTVTLSARITNTGSSTWVSNVYWVHVTDSTGSTVGYINAGGITPGNFGDFQYNVTIPNIGGTGTATYHFRMLQGGVEWFGSTLDIPVIIDYKPSTALSASAAYLPSGQQTLATNVSSTTSAAYANVINQAIDYATPGSGSWVSGTAGMGTRWDGSATSSNTISKSISLNSAGTWQFRARGQDNVGQLSDFQYVSVTIAPPVITSTLTATGAQTVAFAYQITANNIPASFSATGLPPGLTVNTSNGLISGVPSSTGTYSVIIQATNSAGTGSATLNLTIGTPPPAITSSNTAAAVSGQSFLYQITASNSPTSFGAAALPSGVSVNVSSGRISGTPNTVGTYVVSLSATNGSGTGYGTLTITVAKPAPVITSSSTAAGVAGVAFSYQISATNTPTSYGASGLPAGLSVNSSTGAISGVPSASGSSTITLSATNSTGTGTATLNLSVSAAPTQTDSTNQVNLNIHIP